MQTFSRMQRSGDDVLFVKTFFVIALLVYEPLTATFFYLPPLLGVGAWFIFRHASVSSFLWLAYFYLFEVDHGLPFFSLFFTLILYGVLYKRVQEYIACSGCLYLIMDLFFYLLFLLVLLLYRHVLGIELVIDPLLLLYYAFMDGVVYYAL